MRLIYCDLSTAPIEGVVDYIEAPDEPQVPGNYKKPETIAEWHATEKPKIIAAARQKAIDRAALDPDLCRITGIGIHEQEPVIRLCRTEDDERQAVKEFAVLIGQRRDAPPAQLVGFNALRFDWPVLVRRARYLGVKLSINMDRYRTSHIDVSKLITNNDMLTAKSLGFYVKRLGWTDLAKPLSGAEEAQVFTNGKWKELEDSLAHDVEATRRLHKWWEQR